MRRIAAALAAMALLASCGGEGGDPTLKVSAAASLKAALEDYGESLDGMRPSFSFAGSDELAAQIRKGGRPDVFAAANTKLPAELHQAGLLERPVAFAANRLVVAVPAGSVRVRGLRDLALPGIRIAAGAPSVPVGAYTREVLRRMGDGPAQRIERNIRSNEPDVAGVSGKVAQGAVDAGFVYATDVLAARGRLRPLAIPEALRPQVTYGAAVVAGSAHAGQARTFVEGLLDGEGARALMRAGFEPPARERMR